MRYLRTFEYLSSVNYYYSIHKQVIVAEFVLKAGPGPLNLNIFPMKDDQLTENELTNANLTDKCLAELC